MATSSLPRTSRCLARQSLALTQRRLAPRTVFTPHALRAIIPAPTPSPLLSFDGRPFSTSRPAFVTSDPAKAAAPGPTGETVQLASEIYEPPSGAKPITDKAKSVVICHGLFGSKQNWRSIAKAMAQKWGLPIHCLDLRNHGTSPHIDGMNYADMAADIARYVDDKGLEQICLIGHSMGGKTVLAFALSPSLGAGTLSHLVSVDMTPARGPLSPEFERYVESMLEINASKVSSRQQADDILKKVESNLGTRQFLLTNLQKSPGESSWSMRVPIEKIKAGLAQIGDFPYDLPQGAAEKLENFKPEGKEEREWKGRTLFVKGATSKYVNRRNIPICDGYFPSARHVTLDAGHWVQADKPREFIQTVEEFLSEA